MQGDCRSYKHVVALSGRPDWDTLFALAKEIPQDFHIVNRVVYLFGEKQETTKVITPTRLTPDVIEQVRQADAIVNELLFEYGLMKSLSQVPVISFPVPFGVPGGHSIAIRTFVTRKFMTGRAAVPGKHIPMDCLEQMVKRILKVPGVSRVAYDLTGKPPGTTEWE